MEELLNKESLLIQEMIKGIDMHSLVNLSAKLLGNPVAFYLLSLTEYVHSDNYPKEATEDLINCRFRSTQDEIDKWSEMFKESIRTCTPSIQSWPYQRHRHIICGSSVGGSLVGYITAPQNILPLEKIDWKLFQLIAGIFGIALHLQKDSYLKTSESSLLWGLLTDNISDDYFQRNIIVPTFGSLTQYRMLWFLTHTVNGNQLTNNDVYELLISLKNKWYVLYEEGYAVITDGSDIIKWESLVAASEKKDVLIGVSDVFSNLKNIKKNFRDAQYALRYSTINGATSGIVKYNDFKLSHLIAMAGEHLDLSIYTSNYIDEIEQYDIKNNSEYLNTLRAFLKYNRNIDEISKKLFIHKNTVLYRIRRLEELFQIDLQNIYQISSLVCSLIIHDNSI